jgi:hypothetical protein
MALFTGHDSDTADARVGPDTRGARSNANWAGLAPPVQLTARLAHEPGLSARDAQAKRASIRRGTPAFWMYPRRPNSGTGCPFCCTPAMSRMELSNWLTLKFELL